MSYRSEMGWKLWKYFSLSLCSVHVQYYCSESVFVSSLCCSVELDFKLQEDKLQPLMKRLCPADESLFPPLPYPQETISSTPKRKSKAEAKKHARWKLWFLWPQDYTQLTVIFSVQEFIDRASVHLICFLIRTIQENPIRLFFVCFFGPFGTLWTRVLN